MYNVCYSWVEISIDKRWLGVFLQVYDAVRLGDAPLKFTLVVCVVTGSSLPLPVACPCCITEAQPPVGFSTEINNYPVYSSTSPSIDILL